MPEPINQIAKFVSDIYLQWPALDSGSALIVYIEQFIWIPAIFNLIVRFHAGIFAAVYHVVVALTTGIVFITWFFIPLAVTFPFSMIARRLTKNHEASMLIHQVPKWQTSPWFLVLLIATPAFLATLPSKGLPFPPFHNYLAFGWRYQSIDEFQTIYRVGYWDDQIHELKAFPLGHGGFLDFRQTANMGVYAKIALDSSASTNSDLVASEVLLGMIEATRPIDSNGWLLGKFRAPQHLLGIPGGQSMQHIQTFYLMRSKAFYSTISGTYRVKWEACGEIVRPDQGGSGVLRRFDECREDPR